MTNPHFPVLALLALICALVFGYCLFMYLLSLYREMSYKKTVIANAGDVGKFEREGPRNVASNDISSRIIRYMERLEIKGFSTNEIRSNSRQANIDKLILLSGLSGKISYQSYLEARKRMLAIGAILGAVIGIIFSLELACILAVLGAAVGAQMPKHAIKNRISSRAYEADRHLPEMLDVFSLCMRSGLSIDASISVYAKHFDTTLSRELESAKIKWSSGLERREDALKRLASTYDSVILGRVMDTIVRSARFGSSMAASIESDAVEARSVFRSSKEEKIAKAPVKMMIPTGALILPAMLILVLGPVLLEFVEGGF